MDAFHSDDAFQYIRVQLDKYKNLLLREYTAAEEGKKAKEQLRLMATDERIRLITEIRVPITGKRADIIRAGRPRNEPEEFLVRIQGYVLRSSLPPVLHAHQSVDCRLSIRPVVLIAMCRLPPNARQASQSIVLSGLGLVEFEQGVQAVMHIYDHFCRNLPRDRMDKWEPQTANGNFTLMFTNRYFSSYEEAQGLEAVPLSKDIDPRGVLRKSVPKAHHTSDNEVMYFERVSSTDNRLIVAQDKNNAWIERAKAEGSANSNPLKRRVGYDSESESDEEESRSKRPKTTPESLAGEVASIRIIK
ncbi:hypothetical protein EIP86_000796 [Pleurotus ostreatoroseus]|nr:hypothetical protein EIP86_000796 [Pleurotus ostreatoroseus]